MALPAQKTNREKRKFLSVFLLQTKKRTSALFPVSVLFFSLFILFSLPPMYDGAVPLPEACREIPADAMPHK